MEEVVTAGIVDMVLISQSCSPSAQALLEESIKARHIEKMKIIVQ
jgi:hypothetical protein